MKKFIDRKIGRRLIQGCLSLAALMIVIGNYGFYFSNSELIPYMALMLIALSIIPIVLALIIYFFINK